MNPYTFLVGSARSGTTLLQRLIDAHPMITISPETHWVPRFYRDRRCVNEEGFATNELIGHLVAYWRFPRFRVEKEELAKLLGGNGSVSYATFVTGFYDLIGKAHGKALVGDKTGEYSRELPLLHALWPHARFVHLIRDGRDVALSVMNWKKRHGATRFSTWGEDPVLTTALWWSRNVRLGQESGSSLPEGIYHEIRYENLVARPEDECNAVCVFLDLPYDEAMLHFYEGKTRSDPGLTSKDAWLPVTPNLRNWREQMVPEDVERFEAAAGDLLEELGYERAFPKPRDDFRARADDFRGRLTAELQTKGRPVPAGWPQETPLER